VDGFSGASFLVRLSGTTKLELSCVNREVFYAILSRGRGGRENWVRARKSCELGKISLKSGKLERLVPPSCHCRWDRRGTADRVILALPFSILRTLDYSAVGFNGVKAAAIQQIGYGTNAKLHLQFKERLWNQPGPWGISNGSSFSDTGYQNTWDVTRAQAGATGILVDYTGGNIGASFTGDSSKPSVVHSYALQFLSQLQPIFPGIAGQWNGRATLDTPSRNPHLLGSYSYWKKGQYTTFAGAERERSGNCHFAGEHCSINFQGYMEGGAQEGARAANEILSDYKEGIFP